MQQSTVADGIRAEIRAALARQDKTQAELGEAIGLSQQSVSERMRGRVDWSVTEVAAAADWLGLPLVALFPQAVLEQSRAGT